MADIQRVKDADTFVTDTETVRVAGINTPESVHPDESRNTEEGKQASKFAKDFLPAGTEVEVEEYSKGVFGRDVAGVSKVVNGVNVDYGLVALDQELSSYYTKYGEHPDPLKHDQYKEYYSNKVPYQLGTSEEPLSYQDMAQMQELHDEFTQTYEGMQKGTATREQFDDVTARLYGNPKKVMQYRRDLVRGKYNTNSSNTNTLAGAMQATLETNPEFKDSYNRAVRNGHLQFTAVPEDEPSFWQKFSNTYKMFSSVSNLADVEQLYTAKQGEVTTDIPDEELLKGVPEQFHSDVLQYATKYNDYAAQVYAEQLVEDLSQSKQFDNMEWYAQLGYGLGSAVLDPTILLPVGGAAAASKGIINANKAWQVARVVGGKEIIEGSAAGAKLASWAAGGSAAGALDTIAINTPRLAADHTYTARDYQLELLMGTGFGAALGVGAHAAKAALPLAKKAAGTTTDVIADVLPEALPQFSKVRKDYIKETTASRQTNQSQVLDYVERKADPVQANLASTPELIDVQAMVRTKEAAPKARAAVAKVADVEYSEWSAINKVSADGFRAASATLRNTFPDTTPMRYLLNSQAGLVKKNLPDNVRTEVDKLSSDILHIASAFPDGKVPKNVEKAIQGVTFKQRTSTQNRAMETILKGETTDATDLMNKYVGSLRQKTELWEGYDVVPMSRSDFFAHQSNWLSVEGRANADDIFNLSQELPKGLSFLKDVVELNKLAAKKGDAKFTQLVEELNGMAMVRMEQREFSTPTSRQSPDVSGTAVPMTVEDITKQLKKEGLELDTAEYNARKLELRQSVKVVDESGEVTIHKERPVDDSFKPYKDSAQSFGKTVPMSAPEIAAQLKKEGLTPRTSEYSARMKELRQTGRVAVAEEVNELGRYSDFSVGKKANEKIFDPDKAQEFGEERVTDLRGDSLEQDLLPRSFTEIESVNAFKDVSLENIKNLRKKLRSEVGNKLGVFELKGKKEYASNVERLDKVKAALKSHGKQEVVNRMKKAGKWQNVEDVIRASDALARERKILDAAQKASGEPTKLDMPKAPEKSYVPLQEEDLITVDPITNLEKRLATVEEKADVEQRMKDAYDVLVERSVAKVDKGMSTFLSSGERDAWKAALKPSGALDRVGRIAAKATEDIATKFHKSDLTTLEFFGSRVTEVGRGYGGNIRRKATGGIMRDLSYRESVIQVLPDYVRHIDDYAKANGKNAIQRLNVQQKAGADNKLVKQFNRDVFKVQEYRRAGRESELNVDPSVLKFVDSWNKYMDYNHNELVTNGIGGFTKARKVNNYIPHVWVPSRLDSMVNKHGEEKVTELLRRAYESAQKHGTNTTTGGALELAQRQMKWIRGLGDDTDQFLPVSDSRAKARLELDTTMEYDGLSVLDLLDDEVAGLATKYSNRMAGWVGLSKSTDGLLTSDLDIGTFRKSIEQEGLDKGIDTSKQLQYYDDVINMMFGRPTRGGLMQEMRQLKDLTALTRMGGLGMAQLVETGQVITRSVVNLFSNPKVAQKAIKSGVSGNKTERRLIREIQSISSITDDLEFLERQSVHLDQAELAKVNKARQMSLWLADKATLGSMKAPASRLLGKTTGYNAIRRMQTRVVQSSFALDVANHFKHGTGSMGNKRMADLGLTDVNGVDDSLTEAFSKYAEFDSEGMLTRLNADKWPKEAYEKFQYAMIRDEAQQIQRTHVGELPPWMNKPMMQLLFQFRQMPIVANNKQLSRSLAFADKEATTAVMLNAAMAGLVRYSKFAALGVGYAALTGEESDAPSYSQMQTDKYIGQFGLFPDAVDLVMDAYKAGTMDADVGDKMSGMSGHVPVLGLMKDYYDAGESIATSNGEGMIDAAHGLLPLGNTAYGDLAFAWMLDNYEE